MKGLGVGDGSGVGVVGPDPSWGTPGSVIVTPGRVLTQKVPRVTGFSFRSNHSPPIDVLSPKVCGLDWWTLRFTGDWNYWSKLELIEKYYDRWKGLRLLRGTNRERDSLGRDWGCWTRLRSSRGSGWVPMDSVQRLIDPVVQLPFRIL